MTMSRRARQVPGHHCYVARAPKAALSAIIVQTAEAFFTAEHFHDLEQTWRGCRSCQGRAQWLGDETELDTLRLDELTNDGFEISRHPVAGGAEQRDQFLQQRDSLWRQQRLGLVGHRHRPGRRIEGGILCELLQCLGACLE